MAHRRQFDVALILSQDQDLSEVAEEIRSIAREQGRWIKIASAFPVSPTDPNRRGIDKTEAPLPAKGAATPGWRPLTGPPEYPVSLLQELPVRPQRRVALRIPSIVVARHQVLRARSCSGDA
jgi:hypothetical protein